MVKSFACENCGAKQHWDAQIQRLKCDYCNSTKVVEVDYGPPTEHPLFSVPPEKARRGWDMEMKSALCDSCGARITSGKLAGFCPFCSGPYVRELPPDDEIIRPEHVIRFRVSRKRMLAIFKKWIGRGWLRPSKLKKMHDPGNVWGVYLPFWTYDTSAYSDWTAMSGYYYYVTRTVGSGKNRRTVSERRIRWVPSSGSREGFYDDVLVPATRGLDNDLLHGIYPFNLDNLVPYKPEYLSGWLAEDYSVGLPEGWLTAKKQVEERERRKCAREVPGDTHSSLRVNTVLSRMTYKHILLPVWLASYRYNKRTYRFLVNGQTGKISGHAPISWYKVAAIIMALAAIVAGIWFFNS